MAKAKIIVKDTITNGVALTPENQGKWVEWTGIVTSERTGRVLRVNRCNGYFDGIRPDTWAEGDEEAKPYAYFRNGTLGDTAQHGLFGGPVEHFTNPEVGTTQALSEWLPALAQELHGRSWSPNMDMLTHLEAQRAARILGIRWGMHMPTADVTALGDALRNSR